MSSISFTVPLVKPLCFTQRAVTRVRTRHGTTEMEICSAQYYGSLQRANYGCRAYLERVSLQRRYFEIKGHSTRSLNERNYMIIVRSGRSQPPQDSRGKKQNEPSFFATRCSLIPAESPSNPRGGSRGWLYIIISRIQIAASVRVAHVLPPSVIGPKPLINSRPRARTPRTAPSARGNSHAISAPPIKRHR